MTSEYINTRTDPHEEVAIKMDPGQQDEETLRQELREIVERVPSEDLYAARRYLGYLIASADPFVQSLLESPWDDEPLTAEDEAAIEEGMRAATEGKLISHEEVKRQLGRCSMSRKSDKATSKH